jgi:hypothetical protein
MSGLRRKHEICLGSSHHGQRLPEPVKNQTVHFRWKAVWSVNRAAAVPGNIRVCSGHGSRSDDHPPSIVRVTQSEGVGEMVGAFSTHGSNEKCVQNFSCKV